MVTGTFLWLSHHTGNNNPNWQIFFRGIEATNQTYIYIYIMIYIKNHRASRDVVFIFLHIYCPTHPQFTKHDLLHFFSDFLWPIRTWQEMMVLANRFLTTHTFMLMKVPFANPGRETHDINGKPQVVDTCGTRFFFTGNHLPTIDDSPISLI